MFKSDAQEMKMIIKAGVVLFNNVECRKESGLKLVSKKDELVVLPGTIVIVGNDRNVLELTGSKKFTGYQLLQILNKSDASFKKEFYDAIFNIHIENQVSQTGAAMRGVFNEQEALSYFPIDSVRVISKKINFKIGNEYSNLKSNVVLFHKESGKTISFGMEKNFISNDELTAGTYLWTYSLQIDFKEGSEYKFQNIFFVPSQSEVKALRNEFNSYLSFISGFSSELKKILIHEYETKNKLFVNYDF
jgi:hypothetical protein